MLVLRALSTCFTLLVFTLLHCKVCLSLLFHETENVNRSNLLFNFDFFLFESEAAHSLVCVVRSCPLIDCLAWCEEKQFTAKLRWLLASVALRNRWTCVSLDGRTVWVLLVMCTAARASQINTPPRLLLRPEWQLATCRWNIDRVWVRAIWCVHSCVRSKCDAHFKV